MCTWAPRVHASLKCSPRVGSKYRLARLPGYSLTPLSGFTHLYNGSNILDLSGLLEMLCPSFEYCDRH